MSVGHDLESNGEFDKAHATPRKLGDDRFHITEWDWLKFDLRLLAMEMSGSLFGRYLRFDNERRTLEYVIFHCEMKALVRSMGSIEDLVVTYFVNWTALARSELDGLLQALPNLSKEFDSTRDVTFVISTGRAPESTVICTVRGDNFRVYLPAVEAMRRRRR